MSEPFTFDWQAGGSKDESWRGKSRQWIDDKPGTARALVKNKVLAVYIPGRAECVSDRCSAESADSTTDSTPPDSSTPSCVSGMSGGAEYLPSGSPVSPSTTTYETLLGTVTHSLTNEGHDASEDGTGRGTPLIFSVAVSPAKTSALPDAVPDSKPANDPAFSSSSCGSPMSLFNPEGMSSLRTYPDYFPAKTAEISPSYSRRWPSSGFTTSPGECWTADTSESPNDGDVSSSLADVLQDGVPAKYFLSPKAAAGILRRAEKRGRELPTHLSAALEAVARTTTTDKPAA
jgi:hypothetical protein